MTKKCFIPQAVMHTRRLLNSNDSIQQKCHCPRLHLQYLLPNFTAIPSDQFSRCLWELPRSRYQKGCDVSRKSGTWASGKWQIIHLLSCLLFNYLNYSICTWVMCIRKPQIFTRVSRQLCRMLSVHTRHIFKNVRGLERINR